MSKTQQKEIVLCVCVCVVLAGWLVDFFFFSDKNKMVWLLECPFLEQEILDMIFCTVQVIQVMPLPYAALKEKKKKKKFSINFSTDKSPKVNFAVLQVLFSSKLHRFWSRWQPRHIKFIVIISCLMSQCP